MSSRPTEIVSMEDMILLIQEQLSTGHSVRFSPRGNSMIPMLRHGVDSVVLSPLQGKLKKYDLPLYQRENGQYVLHRVVAAEDTYTCMGDNQFVPEPGLTHAQMIGVVTAFTRKGREYSVRHKGYQLYCRLWYHSRHLRRLWRRGIAFLRRCLS